MRFPSEPRLTATPLPIRGFRLGPHLETPILRGGGDNSSASKACATRQMKSQVLDRLAGVAGPSLRPQQGARMPSSTSLQWSLTMAVLLLQGCSGFRQSTDHSPAL